MRRFLKWLADKLAPEGWEDADGFHLGRRDYGDEIYLAPEVRRALNPWDAEQLPRTFQDITIADFHDGELSAKDQQNRV